MSHPNIKLREVEQSDLEAFFQFQLDPQANHMAAFTAKDPTDRAAFDAKWQRILADPTVVNRTILLDGRVVGSVAKFDMFEKPQVTYWIDKSYWGQGIATEALSQLLKEINQRPLYAQAAADNASSIRVLEKCGFKKIAVDRGFANARSDEIDEVIMVLEF